MTIIMIMRSYSEGQQSAWNKYQLKVIQTYKFEDFHGDFYLHYHKLWHNQPILIHLGTEMTFIVTVLWIIFKLKGSTSDLEY